jgi:hypothetical protein
MYLKFSFTLIKASSASYNWASLSKIQHAQQFECGSPKRSVIKNSSSFEEETLKRRYRRNNLAILCPFTHCEKRTPNIVQAVANVAMFDTFVTNIQITPERCSCKSPLPMTRMSERKRTLNTDAIHDAWEVNVLDAPWRQHYTCESSDGISSVPGEWKHRVP